MDRRNKIFGKNTLILNNVLESQMIKLLNVVDTSSYLSVIGVNLIPHSTLYSVVIKTDRKSDFQSLLHTDRWFESGVNDLYNDDF